MLKFQVNYGKQPRAENYKELNCLRLKCIQTVQDVDRKSIIANFNKMTVNEQNAYLSGLVTVNTVSNRRPRQPKGVAKLHDHSYSYCVRINREHCC